jgi:hypothetical protein
MTNKHKKAVNTTKKAIRAKASSNSENAADSVVPSMEQQPALKTFSKAQLAALLFVSIGCSKIMAFATALKEAGTDDPKTCMTYLDHQETCTHPSFGSLILTKYYSALSLTFLILSLMSRVWKTEPLFLKLMTCLCVTPLSTTALAATYSQDYMQQDQVWNLIIMPMILFATCAPTSTQHLAFLPDRPWTARSLQSITLMGLAVASLWEIAHVVGNPDANWENSLLLTTTPLPEPARALVNFWMVDKLSMAILFAFGVVHFPEHTQRVSSIIAIIRPHSEWRCLCTSSLTHPF